MCTPSISSPVTNATTKSVNNVQWNTRTNGSHTLTVAGSVAPPASIASCVSAMAEPLQLADDGAGGWVDKQFDTAAVLVDGIELAAGSLQLRLLDPVAERLDLGLDGIEGQPLALRRGGAGTPEAAGVGEGRRGQQDAGSE